MMRDRYIVTGRSRAFASDTSICYSESFAIAFNCIPEYRMPQDFACRITRLYSHQVVAL